MTLITEFIITQGGDNIITEGGDFLITELVLENLVEFTAHIMRNKDYSVHITRERNFSVKL